MTPRRFRDVLWVLAFAGATAAFLRFLYGLGSMTALSDQLPWGVWKIVNMVAGVALSTGGFFFAGAVHVFRIRRFAPLLRPALLVACLGYATSCLALFLDIGRPFRIWHPLVDWNIHSFLFEVSWCVMLYFTITLMEVLPIALEDRGESRLRRGLRIVAPFVVVIGITLSMLHHTTLGSLFLVSPSRLHPLWYTGMLPIHFILSAAGAGIFSVVLVTYIVSRLYRRVIPDDAVRAAAVVGAGVLLLYGGTKIYDVLARGVGGLLIGGQWEAGFWGAELLLGVALPVGIVAVARLRRDRRWLGTAAILAISGLVLNRLDVGLVGYFRSAGVTYVPSLAELAVTFGLPAAAGLAFFAFIERFRVFELVRRTPGPFAPFARVSLIFVVTVSVSVGLFTLPDRSVAANAVQVAAPTAVDLGDRILLLDGNRNGEMVRFPHRVHSDWLDGDASCQRCHHLQRPSEPVTSCHECHSSMARSSGIFDHGSHVSALAARTGPVLGRQENQTCVECHPPGESELRATARSCSDCHSGGRWSQATGTLGRAPAYVDALHGLCGRCHDVQPGGRCEVCHPNGQ